jgi:type IV secretion system protein VirD4
MMAYDEIDFKTIGQQKTAVFVEVSDTDRSMDALINIFITQCLNQLCTYADEECEGYELPVPVRFILDDFATNCRITDFDKMISNIRSRKISAMLIIQSLAQLEASYGESANTIIDNCDTQVFMGTNSPQTAYQIGLRCNKSVDTILHMPLRTCWIFRRGEQPVYGNVMPLDDYFDMKGITKEMLSPATTEGKELSEVE